MSHRRPGEEASALLERSTELAAIDAALDAAVAGDGLLLAFEGPAGIGKTRLLERARRTAGNRGLPVLTARGGELERGFAYGIVRQLLEQTVARSDPGQRTALLDGPAWHAARALEIEDTAQDGARPADDQAFAVRHGLYWLVANLAADGPLVLAVDDAQWADAPSLRFLAYLARRLDGLPVLVAVTVRTGDPTADDLLLTELVTDPATRRLAPAPLSLAATAALVARGGEEVDERFAAACHAATGGNPFLLRELRAALSADGIAPVAANADRIAGLGPSTVARSLVLRLSRVSPSSVTFARAVAVLGATADPRLAGELAGLPADEAARAAGRLSRAGVLADTRPLRFAHPILRDAVYRDLPPAERDHLHERAATLLLERGAPAPEVAAHLLATPPAGTTAPIGPLRAAARIALGQGAADLAARYLRRALEEPVDPAERPAVVAALGRATWLAGEDPLGALAFLREALDATTIEADRPALAIDVARAAFSTGDALSAEQVLERELQRDVDRPREETLTLIAEHGSVQLLHEADAECGRRVMQLADLPGETLGEMLALSNVATWNWLHGTAREGAAYAARSLGGGRAVEAAGADSIAILQAAWTLSYAEQHDLAARTIAATMADARRTGSVFGITSSATMAAMIAFRRGDMVTAEAEGRRGMGVPGIPPFVHPTLHAFFALALVERDNLDEAQEVVDRSWVGPYLPMLMQMNTAFWALGRLRTAQGRHADARDAFLSGLERDHLLHGDNPGVAWRLDAALACLALGDHDEAQRLVREHEPEARRWGTLGAIGSWQHVRGMVERDAPAAHAQMEEGVATLARSPARLDHARALVDLGSRLRRDGHRSRAQGALEDGLEQARRCGATTLVRRAHAELLVAGARPRRLQFSGVEALTASERRVCDLAAMGRSNRAIAQELFVTPKTVENQLGRAYAKLGISSRDALAAALDGNPHRDPHAGS